MNLTVQVKLLPDKSQVQKLITTMHYFNDACNYISKLVFDRKIFTWKNFNSIVLHNFRLLDTTLYYHIRIKYPKLNSMHVELSFRKVVEAYKKILPKRKGKLKNSCIFKPSSSIPYNHIVANYNLLVLKDSTNKISLSTICGRDKVLFIIGNHQRKILANGVPIVNSNEARLVFRKGNFYLNIPVEQCVAYPVESKQYIGVDLGVVNIATTSQGKIYSGDVIESKRIKFQKHRSSLQKCGTKSAKRRLKQIAGREQRFRRDVNHCISKALVTAAEGTASGIVLEDLTHIRSQITVRKQQRVRHHGWSFAQLRKFITYKAVMAGVEVKIVNPHYTSQRCSSCGYVSKQNRKNQYRFTCKKCSHDAHADYNASCNLAYMGYDMICNHKIIYQLISDNPPTH